MELGLQDQALGPRAGYEFPRAPFTNCVKGAAPIGGANAAKRRVRPFTRDIWKIYLLERKVELEW